MSRPTRLCAKFRKILRQLLVIVCAFCCVHGCTSPEKSTRSHQPVLRRSGNTSDITLAPDKRLEIRHDSDWFDSSNNRLNIVAAPGETVHAQIEIRSSIGTFADIDFTLAPFDSPDGPAPGIDAKRFRLASRDVDRLPGWHVRLIPASDRPQQVDDIVIPADAPLGGLPTTLRPGERTKLLFEVSIPVGTTAGLYRSAITVTEGSRVVNTTPLLLTVAPYVPSIESSPTILFEIAADHPELGNKIIRDAAIELLREHRVSPLLTGFSPILRPHEESGITADWRNVTSSVNEHISTHNMDSLASAWYALPLPQRLLEASTTQTERSDQYWIEYFRSAATHCKTNDWLPRAIVPLKVHEDTSTDLSERLLRIASLARGADPDLKVVLQVDGNKPTSDYDDLVNSPHVARDVDAFVPPPARCRPAAQSGADQWIQTSQPPFTGSIDISAPPPLTWMIPWQATANDVSTVLLNDADVDSSHINGLLYDGSPYGLTTPIASMRLKNLRRAQQDIARLGLAERLEIETILEPLVERLCQYSLADARRFSDTDVRGLGVVTDADTWRLARQILHRELLRQHTRRSLTPEQSLRHRNQWNRFLALTNTTRLHHEGSRVRINPRELLLVESWLAIENQSDESLSSKVTIDSTPTGWTLDPFARNDVVIPPNARALHALEWTVDTSLGPPETVNRIAIRLVDDVETPSASTTIDVHLIESARTTTAITIDADMKDWPFFSANIATQFESLAGPDDNFRDQTRCHIAHDDQFIYFGIITPWESDDSLSPMHDNLIAFDGVVPHGMDLVQILLDPLNLGTNDPADLYHLAVKPNGARFEKGVQYDGAVKAADPWSADIRYASTIKSEQWIIEIRLPRSAFPVDSTEASIWGLNIARFHAERQIYTSWTGARYNLADPLSLGNVLIPAARN